MQGKRIFQLDVVRGFAIIVGEMLQNLSIKNTYRCIYRAYHHQ